MRFEFQRTLKVITRFKADIVLLFSLPALWLLSYERVKARKYELVAVGVFESADYFLVGVFYIAVSVRDFGLSPRVISPNAH